MKYVFSMIIGIFILICGLSSFAANVVPGVSLMIAFVGGFIIYKARSSRKQQRKEKKEQKKAIAQRESEEIKKRLEDNLVKGELAQKIVSATIIGTDSKLKTGSALVRGTVGDFVAGPVGMVTGIATGKTAGYTKFLVSFADGHQAVEEVKDNSDRFNELVKYLNM